MPSERLPARDPAPRPSPAPETRRLYASDWADFASWCRAAGAAALPADPATVAAYLSSLAPTHGYGALARRLAAIAGRHRQGGVPPPQILPHATALLRARRAQAKGSRMPAPSPDQLTRYATLCTGDRTGQRDRALLLLLATGLSRTAVIGLDAEAVRLTTPGMDLTLRVNGADPHPARIVAIARHPLLPVCPVRALEDWMRASDTAFGPVFRKVDRWGNVEHHRLGADAVRRILLRWSRRAKGMAIRRPPRRGKARGPAVSQAETP
jgi:hypothetical protein